MKKAHAVTALVLVTSALAGCGGGNGNGTGSGSAGTYCDAIQSVKDEVASGSFDTMSQDQFDAFKNKIGDIEALAPDGVAGDWKTLGDYLDNFDSVLQKAGISLDDLQSMQTGGFPSGVDTTELTTLATQIQALTANGDVDAADKAITVSAQSDCSINLGGSGTTPASGAPSS